jgi:hypothetical protein
MVFFINSVLYAQASQLRACMKESEMQTERGESGGSAGRREAMPGAVLVDSRSEAGFCKLASRVGSRPVMWRWRSAAFTRT